MAIWGAEVSFLLRKKYGGQLKVKVIELSLRRTRRRRDFSGVEAGGLFSADGARLACSSPKEKCFKTAHTAC